MKIQFFKNLIKRYNRNTTPNLVSGFTIIEAMVAIFILTVSVSSMLGITASSAASARYANNEITANFLLQEAVDSIRNSRDTLAFQMNDEVLNNGWTNFLTRYGYSGSKCFTSNGCDAIIENFKPADIGGVDIISCPSEGCSNLFYDNTASPVFYNNSGNGVSSEFKRNIKMELIDSGVNQDQVKVTARVEWFNGNETNKRNQELVIYLLNWKK